MRSTVPVALRERLGEDPSTRARSPNASFWTLVRSLRASARAFDDYIDSSGEKWRRDVTATCTERMDLRMENLASRQDLVEGCARIREEMGNLRVELLRWSFGFWISQVAATAGLMALLIRLLQP